MSIVRIKRYKLRKTGKGGSAVTIPEVYLEDIGAKAGDVLDVFRAGKLLIYAPVGIDPSSEFEGGDAA
jgi:antitoxin component of MazEF toxin-antitoxin module